MGIVKPDSAGIGVQGEHWFAAQLPRGWVWQPPLRDLGKDGLIVIRDQSDLHNLEFALQVKTSEKLTVRDNHIVKSGVPRSSVFYWFASPMPTLVVVVDISAKQGWYAFHVDLFSSPKELFQSESDTVTIRIPSTNQLNENGWNAIRDRVRHHYRGLFEILNNSDLIRKTAHSVAIAVRNLIKLSNTPAPLSISNDDEMWTIILEQMQHQNLVAVIRALVKRTPPDSDFHKQIGTWLESYESVALSAHPKFKEISRKGGIPADFEFAYAPSMMKSARPWLIEAGFDMLMLLTSSGKEEPEQPV